MRIVVTGATGNVGTSVVQALAEDTDFDSIVGIARRMPRLTVPKVEWRQADVSRDELVPHFDGADAVIHLAWLIQPSRDEAATHAVNVDGSRRVFEAAAGAGVPRIVHASSVGAYSPGPKDIAVNESHPTGGIDTSFYSRHKAEVERVLDDFEMRHSGIGVARLRPALIFKADAASGIRRLFAGPFMPNALLRRVLIPIVPALPGLRFQAVHSLDVGQAYRLAAKAAATGAFNIAADPVLDPEELGRLLDAKPVPLPPRLVRVLTDATWRARLQPTPPGWLDMALNVPIMDALRAREQLGWTPRYSAGEALLELLDGIREGRGLDTPPLEPGGDGPMRVREIAHGIGGRSF
jgi:nucleoside-diphosphate-sugar epimerase